MSISAAQNQNTAQKPASNALLNHNEIMRLNGSECQNMRHIIVKLRLRLDCMLTKMAEARNVASIFGLSLGVDHSQQPFGPAASSRGAVFLATTLQPAAYFARNIF